MTNMNDEKLLKNAKENTVKSIKKTKINTEVFNVGQKVRESICIRILDNSIFVRIQPLNKYSKGIKGNVVIKGLIVYSRLNYCKVKITESLGLE